MHRFFPLVLVLIAFALRLWALDSKGLSYDEAATALMARATPGEIIAFHWRAAYEHPPVWQLLIHFWSRWVGQSEFALRLPSVLAGVVTLPLLWQLARRLRLTAGTALLAALLAATAPVLVYYSQEARMYAFVVALSVASLLLTHQMTVAPKADQILLYGLVNWTMLGLHYYSALLIAAEGIFLLVWLGGQRRPLRYWVSNGLALALTALPLLLWVAFAPGFHDTVTSVLSDRGYIQPSFPAFLDTLWRDLSFAAIRWPNTEAVWGYVLLPLILLGFIILFRPGAEKPWRHHQEHGLRGTLLLLACLVPVGLTLLLSRTLATRYILYIMPPLLLALAAGITWLGQLHWSLGGVALLVALTPTALALPHYFGPYQKSAYREMITYLTAHRQPDETLLLEGPRQHLLAKYYLPAESSFLTAPTIDLPDYWPVNALPVVPEEMDDVLQQALRDHPGLWLSLTAENEVDPGEFVAKYLTAVAFPRDCQAWLDVRLCHFVSPHFVQSQVKNAPAALFGESLLLQEASVAFLAARGAEPAYLLTTLTWLAQTKPSNDYRVTLRLLDAAGTVVSQRDDFPIGPLLPPSTWNAGDVKPGYLALPIPPNSAPGPYQLTVNLYDPVTLAPVPHHTPNESTTDAARIVAKITIGDTIELTEK